MKKKGKRGLSWGESMYKKKNGKEIQFLLFPFDMFFEDMALKYSLQETEGFIRSKNWSVAGSFRSSAIRRLGNP